jgi:hypothetical protein
MKGRDGTADAMHVEVEKDADGRRPSPHDFINGQFGRGKRGPFHASSLIVRCHRSLRWHKQCGDFPTIAVAFGF